MARADLALKLTTIQFNLTENFRKIIEIIKLCFNAYHFPIKGSYYSYQTKVTFPKYNLLFLDDYSRIKNLSLSF